MAVDDQLIGEELGVFAIQERLGAGGMGVVYRAVDQALDRPVALKILAPHLLDDPTARARFQREISTAIGVEHPNIVPIYQAGYEAGRFFIAMRLVAGADLGAVISSGPLDVARAMRLFAQVAAALSHVHRRGIVHRDIKPQNILVADPGDEHEYALLTDFGIARALDKSTALTRGIIGSAPYIAPEILRWEPATPLSDQYSLGCVLYEMLAGVSPFEGADLPAAHLHEPVPSVSDALPSVPDAICAAIERVLDKEPHARFKGITEFASAIRTGDRADTPAPSASLQGRARPQATELTTLTEFHQAKVGPGVIVITDSAAARPRAHDSSCAYVREDYFTTKVLEGKSKNGRYYRVDDLAIAEQVFSATPCPLCQRQERARSPEPSRVAVPSADVPTGDDVGGAERVRRLARHTWLAWFVIPMMAFVGWAQAWLMTRARKYLAFAALYSIAFIVPIVEASLSASDEVSTPTAILMLVAWIGGLIHATTERSAVRDLAQTRAAARR